MTGLTGRAMLVAALLAGGLSMVACAPAAPKELTDGAQIVAERCTGCHGIGRIKAASYDRTGWSAVVTDMIAKGAVITDNEAMTLIDFLTEGGAKDL